VPDDRVALAILGVAVAANFGDDSLPKIGAAVILLLRARSHGRFPHGALVPGAASAAIARAGMRRIARGA
jgi:hypothetical protein